jgi:hypothetical protein
MAKFTFEANTRLGYNQQIHQQKRLKNAILKVTHVRAFNKQFTQENQKMR